MNFKEMLEKRHACKLFDGRKIPEEDLKFILESGVLAPSSHGFEPWKFLVIKDAKKREELSLIANHQSHVKNAAVIVIIVSRLDFAEYFEEKLRKRKMSEEELNRRLSLYKPFLQSMDERAKIAYSREQAHIALAGILYAANTLNIATCTIGGFDSAKLNAYLNLDTKKELSTLMIALGYSDDEEIPAKSRFEFDEVVRFFGLRI
ncbi:NAD(P)H-dependent oxidoreductase [Campylobacter upsaliensis]|nr:NAD(P)H-dependent oxidoreductase [Campylobacter upsaliensis]ELJ7404940.1 NAD(P)H-dependent oxidoreductase [Campylobacter upsaliensis]